MVSVVQYASLRGRACEPVCGVSRHRARTALVWLLVCGDLWGRVHTAVHVPSSRPIRMDHGALYGLRLVTRSEWFSVVTARPADSL